MNYRASARKAANELRIAGTVRNLESGEVEAIVTGEIEQLQKFIEWAWQGPDMADVSSVTVEETSFQSFPDFSIIRSKDI